MLIKRNAGEEIPTSYLYYKQYKLYKQLISMRLMLTNFLQNYRQKKEIQIMKIGTYSTKIVSVIRFSASALRKYTNIVKIHNTLC